MLRKEINGIAWLEFLIFQQFPLLKHGIFLRHGGESSATFKSLNLSYSVGDSASAVLSNEKKITSILELKRIVRGNLCHGKEIFAVDHSIDKTTTLCDGLSTQICDTGLLITHADCQAAIFYDPITRSLAVVHAGWRGSVQNIYAETIQQMQVLYGSSPSNIYVGISPSLGPQDSEFIHYRKELPESFWQFQVKPTYFNFWEISKRQLLEKGILSHHIEIAGISTYSNPHDYFSYRRDKITGRNATVAALL